jgi:hypothetical protein
VDVSPPWYTPTAQVCLGETRSCEGGDTACHQQAVRDGYVGISIYRYCRRDDVHTVPRPAGAVLAIGLLAALSVVLWRVRRGRPS